MSDTKKLVQDVVASPLGMVIASVGEAVAQAQSALDEGSIATVLDIYTEGDDEKMALLREIGYRPTFYTLPETTGEVSVALRLGQTAGVKSNQVSPRRNITTPAAKISLARHGLNVGSMAKMYATPVDAGYANRYGFSSNISAKLSFKILPVPAPEGADELRLVPNCVGLTVEKVKGKLEQFGLDLEFLDIDTEQVLDDPSLDRVVEVQIPEPKTIIGMGDLVKLKLKAE